MPPQQEDRKIQHENVCYWLLLRYFPSVKKILHCPENVVQYLDQHLFQNKCM